MTRSGRRTLSLFAALACCVAIGCAAVKKPPASSVVLRSKMDKKIVALNVELRDHRLGEIAQGIAMDHYDNSAEIANAMAEAQSPYVQWEVYRSEKDDLDAFIAKLRRLSPARCGLVDKPAETAICARAVVELNHVPIRASEGEALRIQGASQGSARVEQILVMTPTGQLTQATLKREERAFEATFTPAAGSGLYTVEVVARTGRGIEPAARWWLRVGSADLPEIKNYTPEGDDAKPAELAKRGFSQMNSDRQAGGAGKVKHSAALAKMADERVASYASQGALSPPDQEKLAKMRVEGDRSVSHYTETVADGYSLTEIAADIMVSPSKRRTHLDPAVTAGAVAVARGREKPPRLYLVEVTGRSYNSDNPTELRDAIVDRVNLARSRKGVGPAKDHTALRRYAQKIADRNLKRNDFLEKDDMGRTISDAILADIEGLEFAGSEMFRVSGAEEVTPGATPTNKRFTLVGVGVARKAADTWWVVILVGGTE